MKTSNLKNYVAANKIFLTEQHKLRRLLFARDFQYQEGDFWSHVNSRTTVDVLQSMFGDGLTCMVQECAGKTMSVFMHKIIVE